MPKWQSDKLNYVFFYQQLMVAQKNGIIRFYDILSQQPFMTLSATTTPLKCADWSTVNPVRVGAVACNEWKIWDISQSR